MTDSTPTSWMTLQAGTPIYSADGDRLGEVHEVIADRQKDIFSGVTFKQGVIGDTLFVPADRIGDMTTEGVQTSLAAADASSLEPYSG